MFNELKSIGGCPGRGCATIEAPIALWACCRAITMLSRNWISCSFRSCNTRSACIKRCCIASTWSLSDAFSFFRVDVDGSALPGTRQKDSDNSSSRQFRLSSFA